MNYLFMERTDDEELLQLECEFAQYEIEMRELDFMLEMVEFKEQQDLDRANLKVYAESGSDDDLMYLYEQIYTESEETKKNVFQRIWDGIVGIFKSIKDAITGLFKQNTPKQVEIPKNVNDALKNGQKRGRDITRRAVKVGAIVIGTTGLAIGGKKVVSAYVNHKNAGGQITDGTGPREALPDKNIVYGTDNNPNQKAIVDKDIIYMGTTANEIVEEISNAMAHPSTEVVTVSGSVIEEMQKDVEKMNDTCLEQAEKIAKSNPGPEAGKGSADVFRNAADASQKMTKALLWAKKRTESLGKMGRNKQAMDNVIHKEMDGKELTDSDIQKYSDASDENARRKGRVDASVNKTRNSERVKAAGKRREEEEDLKEILKEKRRTGRATTVNSSAEFDAEGDATFEAGSIDDIMDIIDSL